jgi:hypothetical protein
MKSKTTILLTALLSVIFIMASPTTGYSQITNYCKDGAGPGWWKRLWQKPYKKRESACFGRYAPSGFDAVKPKVVWDASKSGFDLQKKIDDLANYLIDDKNQSKNRWLRYYNEIFQKADKTEFNDFDYWNNSLDNEDPGHHRFSGYFEAAATAKYAAFVYIVGVIRVTNPANEEVLMKYNDPSLVAMGIDGIAELNKYRDRAINILEHLKKSGKQDFRPAPTMMITYGHYRYKETIGFLSAFELLRLSTLTNNRDLQYWQLKNAKLALQGTVRNLYQKTGVFIEGASNNHTLQYAGAMGLAAIVLHDCGSGRWKKTWHPSKWAGKANWHIENTLFENNDRQRMTEEDEIVANHIELFNQSIYTCEGSINETLIEQKIRSLVDNYKRQNT